MKNLKPLRVDEEFYNLLRTIKIERIKRGTDLIPNVSDRRLTKAVARIVKMQTETFNSLCNSPLDDDREYRRRRR